MLNNTSNTVDQKVVNLVNRFFDFSLAKGIFRKDGLGLLVECYLHAAGPWVKEEVKDILLSQEASEIFDKAFNEEECAYLGEHLIEVYDLVMSRSDGVHTPYMGFTQPKEVTDFVCAIAEFPEDVEVYNPFMGGASYAIALSNPVTGEELSPEAWAIAKIRLFAAGKELSTTLSLGDSFVAIESDKKYKAIVSSPAYLIQSGQEIGDVVSKLYDKLENGGKLACLVSAGFLFSEKRSSRVPRERLINDKAIKSVIMLPSNIFNGISIAQALVIITKGETNEQILFADASGYTRFAKSVYRATTFDNEQFLRDLEDEVDDYYDRGCVIDNSTIGAPIKYSMLKGFNLTPSLYLTPTPANGISLADIATVVPELKGKHPDADCFITGSSIPEAMHRKPFVPQKVKDERVATAKNQIMISGDSVILALVSGKIRTAYTEDFNGIIAFPRGFIKVLKPKYCISAKYLAALLSTEIVSKQIEAQTSGVIIPRLTKMDIASIMVPNHATPEEKEKLVSNVISSEMSDLESELQETLDKHKREVRSTRHAMIQTLAALSSNWGLLSRYSTRSNGTIKASDTIGRINPMPVQNLMDSIEYAITTLERQVDSLRFETSDFGQEEAINPYEFINLYIEYHRSPSFQMVNIGNDNNADFPVFDENDNVRIEHTDAANVFYAPAKLVERIFDNIVSNAKAHGFTKEDSLNQIRFDWKTENDDIVITIANNGDPFKEGVSGSDVLMSGFTTALHGKAEDGTTHSGQGGFEIKSLMEGLGSVEVISVPDSEFPVVYKLTFEKTNFATVDLDEEQN